MRPVRLIMQNSEYFSSRGQFDRESDYRIAFSFFKGLFKKGLLTEKELSTARKKLIARFKPPYGGLPDVCGVSIN